MCAIIFQLNFFETYKNNQKIRNRRRKFGDVDKLPVHEYGLYSIKEKVSKQRPVLFKNSPSPPPPIRRQRRYDCVSQTRPQACKTKRGGKM